MFADSRLLPGIVRPGFDHIIMNNPTMTPAFLPHACSLAGRRALIHYYRVSTGCGEVEEEALAQATCKLDPVECVRVLDYSPRTYIWRLTLAVKG